MAAKKWAKAPYEITTPEGETRIVTIGGRVRWAIEELRKAGAIGRTGREALGPRWAAYMHEAKHSFNIPIRDAWEPHEGEHPGRHKRWFLDCKIRPVAQFGEGTA